MKCEPWFVFSRVNNQVVVKTDNPDFYHIMCHVNNTGNWFLDLKKTVNMIKMMIRWYNVSELRPLVELMLFHLEELNSLFCGEQQDILPPFVIVPI